MIGNRGLFLVLVLALIFGLTLCLSGNVIAENNFNSNVEKVVVKGTSQLGFDLRVVDFVKTGPRKIAIYMESDGLPDNSVNVIAPTISLIDLESGTLIWTGNKTEFFPQGEGKYKAVIVANYSIPVGRYMWLEVRAHYGNLIDSNPINDRLTKNLGDLSGELFEHGTNFVIPVIASYKIKDLVVRTRTTNSMTIKASVFLPYETPDRRSTDYRTQLVFRTEGVRGATCRDNIGRRFVTDVDVTNPLIVPVAAVIFTCSAPPQMSAGKIHAVVLVNNQEMVRSSIEWVVTDTLVDPSDISVEKYVDIELVRTRLIVVDAVVLGVRVTLRNNGGIFARQSHTGLMLNNGRDNVLSTAFGRGGIASGRTVTFDIRTDKKWVLAGSRDVTRVRVQADPHGYYIEQNEDNNILEFDAIYNGERYYYQP